MKTETNLPTIDSLVNEFDISKINLDSAIETECLTFWLPVEYKTKYDLLQERTKRKFGKLLKEILKRSIDRVEISDRINQAVSSTD